VHCPQNKLKSGGITKMANAFVFNPGDLGGSNFERDKKIDPVCIVGFGTNSTGR
jgi:hypothetical protein